MPKLMISASQDAYVSWEDTLAFIEISDGPSHHDELGSWKIGKRDFRYTRWPAGWSVMLASGEPGLSQ